MEKRSLRIEQVPVVIRTVQIMFRLMLQTQRGSHARQTPLVVRGTQGNSHRLPLFPRIYFRHGFFLAGIESRNISFLHVEAVQPPGSCGRPRCQRFLLHAVFSIRVRFPQIEIPDTLTPCIGHDRHTMITIHPARISRNLREIRKAVTSVRLCHSQKRTNHIRMLRGVEQNTQRMCRTVTVPNPVIRIICVPAIIMYLVVIDAEITSVLAYADRTLQTTVQRRIKHMTVVLRTSRNPNLSQLFIPYTTAFFGHRLQLKSRYFPLQVLLGLLHTDIRYAITDVQRRQSRTPGQCHTNVVSFRLPFFPVPFSVTEHTALLRRHVRLHINVHFQVIPDILITVDRVPVDCQFSISTVQHQIRNRILPPIIKMINGRLAGRGKIHVQLLVA